jgi:anti-sigma B factor antagonist
MSALILTTRHARTGPVLAVVGILDHKSSEQFRKAVDAITLQPGQLLTVDLAGLTLCDSTGITALIAARNRTHTQDADITLAAVPAHIVRIMRIVGLDRIFRFHPGIDGETDTPR